MCNICVWVKAIYANEICIKHKYYSQKRKYLVMNVWRPGVVIFIFLIALPYIISATSPVKRWDEPKGKALSDRPLQKRLAFLASNLRVSLLNNQT